MALTNSIIDQREHVYFEIDDNVSDSIAMLAKNFGRVMRRLEKGLEDMSHLLSKTTSLKNSMRK